MNQTAKDLNVNKQVLSNMGVIAPWYLYYPQLKIYSHLHDHRFPFIECSRRIGKTTSTLIYISEALYLTPNIVARWCEPWKYQAREIVIPEADKIFLNISSDRRPKYSKSDSFYEFHNGSRLYLRGVNEDRGESSRGSFAHYIICDEYGTWVEPDYITKEVLMPQLLTTKGKMIRIGTPPRDLGHVWYQQKEKAIEDKTFFQMTINEADWIDDEEKMIMANEVGGVDSPSWRREFLCEPVTDPESLVIPEFKEKEHTYDEYKRPDYFAPYIGADFGFKDFTAIVFGYIDFLKNKLIIEDEIVVQGKNSKDISEMVRQKEQELGYTQREIKRTADAPAQQIYDLQHLHNLTVVPALKDDKFAAINALRVVFQQNKILLSKKCKSTIYQLKVGIWNDRRTDFERSEHGGHLDSVMALVYLNRFLKWHENPFPKIPEGVTIYDHYIPDEMLETDNKKLADLFTPFKKRF